MPSNITLISLLILLVLSDVAVFARLPLPGSQAPVFRVLSVGDGDGIKVKGPDEKTLTIRFSCIDAPELKQELGQESKAALMQLVPVDSLVKLSISPDKETYSRTLADVYAVDPKSKDFTLNVNLEMVKRGYAFVYCHYLEHCDANAYFAAEAEARNACKGVWKTAGGMQRPWNWRSISKGGHPFRNDCPKIDPRPTCWSNKKTTGQADDEASADETRSFDDASFDNDENGNDDLSQDTDASSNTHAMVIAVLLMGGIVGYVYAIPSFRASSSSSSSQLQPAREPMMSEKMVTASRTWLVGAVAGARRMIEAARGVGASQVEAYHSAADGGGGARESGRDQELLAVERP